MGYKRNRMHLGKESTFNHTRDCVYGIFHLGSINRSFPQAVKNHVTVVGNDTIGIIAKVSAVLAAHDANILDISQTVLSGMFNLIMIVDISLSEFASLSAALTKLGAEIGLEIRIQRSEIFDAMHRI